MAPLFVTPALDKSRMDSQDACWRVGIGETSWAGFVLRRGQDWTDQRTGSGWEYAYIELRSAYVLRWSRGMAMIGFFVRVGDSVGAAERCRGTGVVKGSSTWYWRDCAVYIACSHLCSHSSDSHSLSFNEFLLDVREGCECGPIELQRQT